MGSLRTEFEEFVIGSSDRLLRVALALTADADAARDLLQEVLERMYARWPRIDDPVAYARAALVNANRNRLLRRRRRPETPLEHHEPAYADASDAVEDQQLLLAALRRLSAQQRAVLVLRFLEDMSVEETASVLRLSPGTVKSHTSRGVERLRELLDGPDVRVSRGEVS